MPTADPPRSGEQHTGGQLGRSPGSRPGAGVGIPQAHLDEFRSIPRQGIDGHDRSGPVGDVAGPYQFTHTAAHQAWYASVNALFGGLKRFKADYRVIPWVTFTSPEVARVGLSEEEAKARGIAQEVTRYGLDDLDRAIADGDARGFVKVVTAAGKDRVLGATVVGEHAGELLAEFTLAMKHGLGLNKLLGTIHIYPTMMEANKYVAGNWKRANKPEKLLQYVERFFAWRRGQPSPSAGD